MTVYVDEIKTYPKSIMDRATRRNGTAWCHMTSDNEEELHVMALKIGLRREWFQDHGSVAHYDMTPPKRILAIRFGAIEKLAREQAKERIEARRLKL